MPGRWRLPPGESLPPQPRRTSPPPRRRRARPRRPLLHLRGHGQARAGTRPRLHAVLCFIFVDTGKPEPRGRVQACTPSSASSSRIRASRSRGDASTPARRPLLHASSRTRPRLHAVVCFILCKLVGRVSCWSSLATQSYMCSYRLELFRRSCTRKGLPNIVQCWCWSQSRRSYFMASNNHSSEHIQVKERWAKGWHE
jgi:hypothetical protein